MDDMDRPSSSSNYSEERVSQKAGCIVVLCIWIFSLAVVPCAGTGQAASKEYTVKLVFLYNFLKFVEWPKEKIPDSNEPMIIGIIGTDVFKGALEAVQENSEDSLKVSVKRFKGVEELEESGEKKSSEPHPQIEDIRKCSLLFVCPSERRHIEEILESVKGHHVLTVADTDGFLEDGGIINLLVEDERVRFEINLGAAQQEKLAIRSKLLRLAKRIYNQPK